MKAYRRLRDVRNAGVPHTFGTGVGAYANFGAAHLNGALVLYTYKGTQMQPARNIKCATYRKAQRKLLQFLKGYNV